MLFSGAPLVNVAMQNCNKTQPPSTLPKITTRLHNNLLIAPQPSDCKLAHPKRDALFPVHQKPPGRNIDGLCQCLTANLRRERLLVGCSGKPRDRQEGATLPLLSQFSPFPCPSHAQSDLPRPSTPPAAWEELLLPGGAQKNKSQL